MKAPLAIRDGVGPSRIWLHEGAWKTTHQFLCERFPAVSSESWITRMQAGEIVDSEGVIIKPDTPYKSGTHLYYYRELEYEVPVPFQESILYENEHILIADKPHFLPVMPAGRFLQETLLIRLRKKTGIDHLNPVHRIDRDTAGLVLFSKKPETRGKYHLLFQNREIQKSYEAIAPTLTDEQLRNDSVLTHCSRLVKGDIFFLMKEDEGKANSETQIEYIQKGKEFSHYKLTPITGKQHQLRVHLCALGIPIKNDPFYPLLKNPEHTDFSEPLQLLAKKLSFKDPVSGEDINIFSKHKLLNLFRTLS